MTSVFITDDHAFFRSGLAAALTAAGHEVVGTAVNGAEALDAIPAIRPDVVILDLRMPVLDGLSTLENLRERGDVRPVIILANEVSSDQAKRLFQLGVESILLKQGNEMSLLHAIDMIGESVRLIDGQVLDSVFKAPTPGPDSPALTKLSPRERIVAGAVFQGKRNRQIAEMLGTTEGTIKAFLHGIYAKLGISSRTELAVLMQSDD